CNPRLHTFKRGAPIRNHSSPIRYGHRNSSPIAQAGLNQISILYATVVLVNTEEITRATDIINQDVLPFLTDQCSAFGIAGLIADPTLIFHGETEDIASGFRGGQMPEDLPGVMSYEILIRAISDELHRRGLFPENLIELDKRGLENYEELAEFFVGDPATYRWWDEDSYDGGLWREPGEITNPILCLSADDIAPVYQTSRHFGGRWTDKSGLRLIFVRDPVVDEIYRGELPTSLFHSGELRIENIVRLRSFLSTLELMDVTPFDAWLGVEFWEGRPFQTIDGTACAILVAAEPYQGGSDAAGQFME
ncbi:hypothetical protein, partial [Roseinatronobacter alkalisoli]